MRKIVRYVVDKEGRDKDKVFVITEMSATRTEKLAWKAIFALTKAGIDIPPNLKEAGAQALAMIGLEALFKSNFADVEPLMDELLTCVEFQPDPRNPKVVRYLAEDDFEEAATIADLRMEVVKVHLNFSGTDAPPK